MSRRVVPTICNASTKQIAIRCASALQSVPSNLFQWDASSAYGKAAACLDTDKRWGETLTDDIALLRDAEARRSSEAASPGPAAGAAAGMPELNRMPDAVDAASTRQNDGPAVAVVPSAATDLPADPVEESGSFPRTISGLAQMLEATRL
ncbi:MAG: hypothetical protein ACXU8R_17925, partial [Xanthobacteraceae bacterium]